MSGYLQRLVSCARAPSAAIRPVVGPLFSASTYQGSAEDFQAVEEIVISRQPGILVTPAPQPPRAIPPGSEPSPTASDLPYVPAQTQAAQATVQSEDSRLISEARESFQPPLTQVPLPTGPKLKGEGPRSTAKARESSQPPLTQVPLATGPKLQTYGERGFREKPVGGTEPSLEGSDQHVRVSTGFKDGKERVEPRLEQPSQRIIPGGPYRPLVAEGLRPTEARAFQNWSSLTSEGRRIDKADLPRPVARPEREADEIQIHIGRIEVTAVQPLPAGPAASPRPAAPPVRKSLRLDEYLRSSRERAL
jgi:hypothetical protein